jgi:periplasmic divalent cation tolerance protein
LHEKYSVEVLVPQLRKKYKRCCTAGRQKVQGAQMKAVIVLTTVGTTFDVVPFARTLVDEHLAACVNVLPQMQSVYRWQGQVQVDDERQLIIKTSAERLEALQLRVRALHPYELPELLVIDAAGGSLAYLDWLSQSTTPAEGL